ncbi:uncharacterized protein TNCV_2293451 [Trichonephila clavipes]|nr:uncharacterized protein TNCV_2293451 [Trichonephila clavipes]
MRKTAALWAPHQLTEVQKWRRLALAGSHQERYRNEGHAFLQGIVIIGEKLSRAYESKSKRQSSFEFRKVSKISIGTKKIELREDLKSRRGLAVSLEIICHNCGESTSTMSSKISNKCYDVNVRLTYGMRAIGKGGAAARIFCGLMNLPPPPAKFERHNSLFLNVLKTISEDSMNAAVHEAVIANDNNSNIAVAVDGTWHKRGYSSLNGVVCATSVEKGKWGNGMSGVLSIFQRSETSRKACYTQYLGDGDSKGFLTIKEAKVYSDTDVEKLECVGHVQKRMGTRLRNILKMSKGIKLSDGENISRRGRLTLKEVDSIQHYYGLTIRKNLSSVEDMKRAIWAIYFHKLSTEDNPQHALCPLVVPMPSSKSPIYLTHGRHNENQVIKLVSSLYGYFPILKFHEQHDTRVAVRCASITDYRTNGLAE